MQLRCQAAADPPKRETYELDAQVCLISTGQKCPCTMVLPRTYGCDDGLRRNSVPGVLFGVGFKLYKHKKEQKKMAETQEECAEGKDKEDSAPMDQTRKGIRSQEPGRDSNTRSVPKQYQSIYSKSPST